MKLRPSYKIIMALAVSVLGAATIFTGMAMVPPVGPQFVAIGEAPIPPPPQDNTGGMVALVGYVLAGIGGLALAWQLLMVIVRAIARTAAGAVKGRDE
jgi:hypothetical protein